MHMHNDIASQQPTNKFSGMYDEVREELEQFRYEMERHKALLNGTGVLDRDE